MSTRAIREGQNTPRNPRIPRNMASDLRKRGREDHFYPPRLRGVTPRRVSVLRGMRGIGLRGFRYPPQHPQVYLPWSQSFLRGMRGLREIIRPNPFPKTFKIASRESTVRSHRAEHRTRRHRGAR